jgi:hypothetical protein
MVQQRLVISKLISTLMTKGKIETISVVESHTYNLTPDLYELLTLKEPHIGSFADEDYKNYGKILLETGGMQKKNDRVNSKKRSKKWTKYVEPIWKKRINLDTLSLSDIKHDDKTDESIYHEASDETSGHGVQTIILLSDQNELVRMLQLRLALFHAGNTGVRNEIVSICDELKHLGLLSNDAYKNLMMQFT